MKCLIVISSKNQNKCLLFFKKYTTSAFIMQGAARQSHKKYTKLTRKYVIQRPKAQQGKGNTEATFHSQAFPETG